MANVKSKKENGKLFGGHVRELRVKKGWSINDAGERLGVSANYVSMLERGVRHPTNKFIEALALLYDEDEDLLYKLLGKIPKSVLKSIEENIPLQNALLYAKNLSEPRKKELEEEILRVYKEFAKVHENPLKE